MTSRPSNEALVDSWSLSHGATTAEQPIVADHAAVDLRPALPCVDDRDRWDRVAEVSDDAELRPHSVTAEPVVSAAVDGLRGGEHTGVLTGEDHRIHGADERARELLQLPEIPREGIDWIGMTPPEFRAADDHAMSDAVQYGASRWFRKEFVLQQGEHVTLDLLVIATEVSPFRWVALVREAGSSPLPAFGRSRSAVDTAPG